MNRSTGSIFALLACILLYCVSPTSASCADIDITLGLAPCSLAGRCVNMSLELGIVNGRSACLCEPYRYENDGSMSSQSNDARCDYDMAAAAPKFYRAGDGLIRSITFLALLILLCTFVYLFIRTSGGTTRFERIKVESRDALKPTRGQLFAAKYMCLFCIILAFWYVVDAFIDPFGSKGVLNSGLKLQLQPDGTTKYSGVHLREAIEDLSELVLFIVFCLVFLPWRRICVPAPALLSGDRFMKNWDEGAAYNKGTKFAHNVYVRTQAELEEEERKQEERERKLEEEGGDTEMDREERWRLEEQRVLRHMHEELALADIEAARGISMRKAALERKQTRFARGPNTHDDLLAPSAPPAPPSSPPSIPAPKLVGSPSKYVVTDEDKNVDQEEQQPQTKKPNLKVKIEDPAAVLSNAPVRAPAAIVAVNGSSIEAQGDFREFGSPAHAKPRRIDIYQPQQEGGVPISPTAAQEARLKNIAENLPSDEVMGIDPQDLASFPVPDSLKLTFMGQFIVGVLLVALWILAHFVAQFRWFFALPLIAAYLLLHVLYSWWILSYYDPLYLISLKEDLLIESGIRLPKHRLITMSAGSDVKESTSTSHFGIRTAYELWKAHQLFTIFFLLNIGAAVLQNAVYLYIALTTQEHMSAQTYICWSLLNRFLQVARIAIILFTTYPFQPVIQYVTLCNFWLDGKLEWKQDDEVIVQPSGDQVQAIQLKPQFAQADEHGDVGVILTRKAADASSPSKKNGEANTPMSPSRGAAVAADGSEYNSAQLTEGCLSFIPLTISTTFRLIPTRDEIEEKKHTALLPKLMADLQRMRALDRESHARGGKGSRNFDRLWKPAARYHYLFLEQRAPNVVLAKVENEQFEKAIAHQQFVLWRRQQLKARGLSEKQRKEQEAKEAVAKSELDAAAKAAEDDPFKPFQEIYGDGDGDRARALQREEARQARAAQKESFAEKMKEEFRKLHAIRDANQKPSTDNTDNASGTTDVEMRTPVKGKTQLPSLISPPRLDENGLPVKIKVVLQNNKPIVVRSPQPESHAISIEKDTSQSASVSSGRSLLPGSVNESDALARVTSSELNTVLNEEDDFVSESRSNVHELQTPRTGRKGY